MRTKKFLLAVLLLFFFSSLLLSSISALPATQKNRKEAQAEKEFIPKEVKSVLLKDLKTRQARLDIPFSVFKHLCLPARNALHNIFFLKLKNSDLGFSPLAPAPKKPEEKKEEKKEEAQPEPSQPVQLMASFNVFLQFHLLENNIPTKIVKEVYVPGNFQVESTSYDPDKEEVYTIGYPLLPGNYLLAMAITSLDLTKIGTFYFEFSLPDAASITKKLETTPIFLVKEMKQMQAAETIVEIHKDFFTYSYLQILPNLESVIRPGDPLDIFFYIFGTQPNEQQKFNIETKYEVLKLLNDQDIAKAKETLLLEAWSWSLSENKEQFEVRGEVKNLTATEIKNVEAVAYLLDKSGAVVQQQFAPIDVSSLGANQTSTFKVQEKISSAIYDVRVDFRLSSGENIPVLRREEVVIRFEPALYEIPIISHALPMKQTVLTRTGTEERRETRDLAAGNYILGLQIADNISGYTVRKRFEFSVK